MELQRLVPVQEYDLGTRVEEELERYLQRVLPPEHWRLVDVLMALKLDSVNVSGQINFLFDRLRQEAPDTFKRTLSDALDRLPREHWPLEVYDVYPWRDEDGFRQAKIRRLVDDATRALCDLPEQERLSVLGLFG